jgi:hypothetical protein
MRTDTVITDTQITITSYFQNSVLRDFVTIGAGEDTNSGNTFIAHKNACKGVAPAATAPSCTASPIGQWVLSKVSSTPVTVTGKNEVIAVPTGNAGVLLFSLTNNDGTDVEYSKNGGTWTAFTNGVTITLVNGDQLKLQCNGLPSGGSCIGSVIDNSTSMTLDLFQFKNPS